MWSAVPVLGWLLGAFCAVSAAIPFYYLWDFFGPIYFDFVPEKYQHLPFWHCVGLFLLISILKFILLPSFSSTNTNKCKGE